MRKTNKKDNLTVDTPWGKLITAKGVLEVFSGLEEEVNRIGMNIKKINNRIARIEIKLSEDLGLIRFEKQMKEFDQKITELEARLDQFTQTVKKILLARHSED